MGNGAIGIHAVGTPCYSPSMGEKKDSYPLRATKSWAGMVKTRADAEKRPAGNLIEAVMYAYCNDAAVRESVHRFLEQGASD
jgi:hypothetical protein